MGAFAPKPEKKSKATKSSKKSKISHSAAIKLANLAGCRGLIYLCKYENVDKKNCKEEDLKKCKKMIKENKKS